MPRNSQGVYTVPNTFTPNTVISSSQMNANFADVGQALTNSLDRQGRGGMQANLDFNGYRGVGLDDPSAPQDAATKAYADALLDGPTFATPATVESTGGSAELHVNRTDGTEVRIAASGIGVVETTTAADLVMFRGGAERLRLGANGVALTGTVTANGNTVWDAGNDGAGSGLDADLLDGVQGSGYARLTGASFTGDVSLTRSGANAQFDVGRSGGATVRTIGGSVTGVVGTVTNHDLVLRRNSVDKLVLLSRGVQVPAQQPLEKEGGGSFLYYGSGAQSSGRITVSTSAPSGTPSDGDIWIQREP